jgi:hypothetical protein
VAGDPPGDSGVRADWSQWSEPQLTALLQLSFAVPMHETYLRRQFKVRGPTIVSMVRAGLIRRHQLFEAGRSDLGMPFLTLSQAGEAVKRDYIRWHQGLKIKLGILPLNLDAIAEAVL